MNIIEVKVNNRIMKINNQPLPIVAGNVGFDFLNVEFSEEWEGLDIFANFQGAEKIPPVPFVQNMEIPWESIKEPCCLFITFSGRTDGVEVLRSLTPSPLIVEYSEPKDSCWDTPATRDVIGLAFDAANDANAAASSANSAAASANQAATSANAASSMAQEKASLAQDAAVLANQAASYANEEAESAETAAASANDKAALANAAASNADAKAQAAQTAAENANQATASAQSATSAANSAATSATSAAASATSAASTASDAAVSANTAASAANTAATSASTQATAAASAAQSANTAATSATTAANNINNMTASADTLEPGEEASVTLDKSGANWVLELGIPKGEKGDTGEVSQAELTAALALKVDKADMPFVVVDGKIQVMYEEV